MNIFELIGLNIRPPAVQVDEAAPPTYRCGVGGCETPQVIVFQDDRETVVDCPTHDCVTSWDTKGREQRTQTIIRVQDDWHQHGIHGQPKR